MGWHVTTIVVTTNNFFPTEPIDNWTSDSSKKRVYGSDLLDSISFYFLWGQSSDWGFDDTICNQVKPSDLKTGWDDGMSKIRDLHQSQLCSLLPPAILNHSYSSTHIDQVSAERCEMEWCGVLYGMLRHLRRRSSLITSSIPPATFYHMTIAYWISVNEMLLCPTLLQLILKPSQETDQIIIPCW